MENPSSESPLEKLNAQGLVEGTRLTVDCNEARAILGDVFGLDDRGVEEKFPGLFRDEIVGRKDPITLDINKTDGGMCITLFVKNQIRGHHYEDSERFVYSITLSGPPADDRPYESWARAERKAA